MKGWGKCLVMQGQSKRYFKRYVLCEVNGTINEKEITSALQSTCKRLCGEAFFHLFSFSVVKSADQIVIIRVRAKAHDLGLILLTISLTRVNKRFILPLSTSGSMKALLKNAKPKSHS